MLKPVLLVKKANAPHMVGDGFPVVGYIDSSLWDKLSPFLMLDYITRREFSPTIHPRGVDVHPHKGFETVSILWEGALAHEDSTGAKGVIKAGDVQWMTAGAGILHKEFHEEEFSRKGGVLHGAQVWVNLPAQYKNTPPSYQDLSASSIPVVSFDNRKGSVRVIAGECLGAKGPARTFTRINVWDVTTQSGSSGKFSIFEGDTAAVLVLSGTIEANGEQVARAGEMIVFEENGTELSIESNNDAHFLILSGEPIREPIAAYGPFVMNTQEEIRSAISDYHADAFGYLV
jgi:redox-sensitive bicupin YhaK (pirin superfamily)